MFPSCDHSTSQSHLGTGPGFSIAGRLKAFDKFGKGFSPALLATKYDKQLGGFSHWH